MSDVTAKDLFEMHKSGGGYLSYSEIGQRFGLSKDTVAGRVKRYRKRLSGQVEDGPTEPKKAPPRFGQSSHNTARASSSSTRIKSPDDLIAHLGIDTNVWKQIKAGSKIWEGYAKYERTDLELVHGRTSGTIKRGGIEVEPLYSVWIDFVRINPVPVHPVVQPIQSTLSFPKVSFRPSSEKLGRTLVFSDPHFGFHRSTRTAGLNPFHCRSSLDLVVQVAIAAQVDRIDILGDFLDLPEWSDRFLKHPQFYWSTQPSLIEGHWWLSLLRQSLPHVAIKLHQGNHDKRLPDAIIKHFPAAYELRRVNQHIEWPTLSVPYLLALDDIGVEWIADYPDDIDWLNDSVYFRHGNTARGKPLDTTYTIARNADRTEVSAHIHRLEMSCWTRWERSGFRVVQGVALGCTCRIDGGGPPGRTKQQQWQNAFGIIDYDDKDLYSIFPLLIQNNRVVWDGHVFTANPGARLSKLKEDFPGWKW